MKMVYCLRSNSLRSTERELFPLYTNTNSYKDNTAFDELVAQAIKQLALLTKSHSKDYKLLERFYYIITVKA